MMKELRSDEPYEVAPGCPTITFELPDGLFMLPWSSFASGTFKNERIELIFQDWTIRMDGDELDEVWRLLQLQDLRSVGLSFQKIAGTGARIHKIAAEKLS